jgi:hypothetical protein
MRQMRKKIWIDRFQTSLAVQIASYCVLYQIITWFSVVFEYKMHGQVNSFLGPVGGTYLSALMLAPVVVLVLMSVRDAVKISHRVVGPLVRFRKAIHAITAGEEVELVQLRDGDYLRELMDDLNEMLRALQQHGAVVLKAPAAGQGQDLREPADAALAGESY